DDERDDTYDLANVGGILDPMAPSMDTDVDADPTPQICGMQRDEVHGLALFKLFKSSPGLFGRDATTRRSARRVALRRDTGMTDEAIEGWALMLTRDPKRMSNLERNFALLDGLSTHGQRNLPSSSYREPASVDSGTAT